MNLDKHKKMFKNHVAEITDYGNIKILDFKRPDSNEYRIRFLFEEDYCRLHISGDLGELTASNYYNMTYEKFSEYVNNVGYFESKIDCHSRPIYVYDEEAARDDLKDYIYKYNLYEIITSDKYEQQSDEEKINEVIDEILYDYSDNGIGSKGYEELSKYMDDVWEIVPEIGKRETGILDLYMLAFRLASNQLVET